MRILIVAVGLSLYYAGSAGAQEGFLIRNARLIDGSGTPARPGGVRVVAGRISAVGSLTPSPGERVVDAGGLVLAPGFIDTHSHADDDLERLPDALGAVSQGITTVIGGQDGGSPFPLSDYFAGLESRPVAVNLASYAGHNTIRSIVLGEHLEREASPEEIGRMR